MYWYINTLSGRIFQLPNEAEAVHYAKSDDLVVFMADLTVEGVS